LPRGDQVQTGNGWQRVEGATPRDAAEVSGVEVRLLRSHSSGFQFHRTPVLLVAEPAMESLPEIFSGGRQAEIQPLASRWEQRGKNQKTEGVTVEKEVGGQRGESKNGEGFSKQY